MPGNVCYGCGKENHEGLKIRSYWEVEEAVCIWHSKDKYNGWKGILNGGVLATLIDCHLMCTAMAAAYRAEGRDIDSEPVYHYATASLNIRYLKPTSNDHPIEIRATVKELKGQPKADRRSVAQAIWCVSDLWPVKKQLSTAKSIQME